MDFFTGVVLTLFGQDQRFVVWKQEGIPEDVRREVAAFWMDPDLAELRARNELTPRDLPTLMESLHEIAEGRLKAGGSSEWIAVASGSESLAARRPEAAVVVALQAMAAWVGALGSQLFSQPWEGHHPGWHVFPLAAGRALVTARAVWSARFVCESAAGFIEPAKQAPSDPRLRAVLAD